MHSPRIVVYGATGYTGRLTAQALMRQGARPMLVARDRGRLTEVATEVGGELETAVADSSDPESLRALLSPGDVLLTTVGPFARFGASAVQAAIGAGATYIDSTGESAFIRRIFEGWSNQARAADTALLTAMGYDYVPGNLAAAMALAEAGASATKVQIGYFMTGPARGGFSGGTRASAAGALMSPGYGYRDGRLVTERTARKVKSFEVERKRRPGVSIGTTEHFGLPEFHPWLQDVEVYLGWFGPLSRPMQAMSLAGSVITRIPRVSRGYEALAKKLVKGSSGGPDADARAQTGSHIVAHAVDASGNRLAEVRVAGVNGYAFTAEMLAWAARQAASGGITGTGALGPVQAFGLDGLRRGCAEAGLLPDSDPHKQGGRNELPVSDPAS